MAEQHDFRNVLVRHVKTKQRPAVLRDLQVSPGSGAAYIQGPGSVYRVLGQCGGPRVRVQAQEQGTGKGAGLYSRHRRISGLNSAAASILPCFFFVFFLINLLEKNNILSLALS